MQFLAKIPSINQGGCLVAAYAFYLHENKAKRADNFQLVAVYPKGRYNREINSKLDALRKNNLAYINNKSKKASSAEHFVWTFDGGKTLYDADGIFELDGFFAGSKTVVVPHNLTEQFSVSALNNGGWGSDFRRQTGIPKIEQGLNVDLAHINKKSWDFDNDEGGAVWVK